LVLFLLPIDIQSSESVEGHRAAGAGHTPASPAALLHVMNSVHTAADNKKATVLVGLDISAAFDTLAHDVPLQRLQ